MMRYRLRLARTPALKIFASATFLAALASSGVSQAQTAPPPAATASHGTIKTLDRAQIDALLAQPDKVLIVDVRRAEEISSLGGFPVFISVQNADLARLLAYIPRDRVIITVSNHAHRAASAGEILASKGFHVAGAAGALDYEAQGGVLVGKSAAAATAKAADGGNAAPAGDRPGK